MTRVAVISNDAAKYCDPLLLAQSMMGGAIKNPQILRCGVIYNGSKEVVDLARDGMIAVIGE